MEPDENMKESNFSQSTQGTVPARESTPASVLAHEGFGPGFAPQINAKGNLVIEQSGALLMQAGLNLDLNQGGAAVLVAGQDMTIRESGGQVLVAGRDVELTNGGSGVLVVGRDMVVHQGVLGIAIARQVTLDEGSKVLMTQPQAIAFGAALGAVFAVVSWLLKRGKARG